MRKVVVIISVFFVGTWLAVATAQERLIGDLDGNGTVNLDDFFIFSSNFGKTGGEVFDAGSVKVDTVIVPVTLLWIAFLFFTWVEQSFISRGSLGNVSRSSRNRRATARTCQRVSRSCGRNDKRRFDMLMTPWRAPIFDARI